MASVSTFGVPLPAVPPAAGAAATGRAVAVLGDLSEVEDLLDWLEARGAVGLKVVALGPDRFAVRWRDGGPP